MLHVKAEKFTILSTSVKQKIGVKLGGHFFGVWGRKNRKIRTQPIFGGRRRQILHFEFKKLIEFILEISEFFQID
jgi:hypothetical protein